MSDTPALDLSHITKFYGSVQALHGADFVLATGEVHALLGENGAGKSTLMHVAYGMTRPDGGTIRIHGRETVLRSPRDAQALGLGMVHQHFTSIGALTVAENIRLARGTQGRKGANTQGRKDARTQGPNGATAGGMLHGLMGGLEPAVRVERLSVALRQRLEIVKALAIGASILLLDEPSAVLAPSEVEELLGLVRGFAAEGGSVALITHKLPEVFAAADRVTVLRHGTVTLSGDVVGQTEASLAEAMIGKAQGRVGAKAQRREGATAVRKEDGGVVPVVQIDSIAIHSGELVGIAAVEGNGQRELLRAIAGLESMAGVHVEEPVAFVPEDRTTEGLIPELSVAENMVLGLSEDPRWARGAWLDWGAARAHATELIRSFGIVATGPDTLAATLSGGNQQKVVLARALSREPRVLVAENPTRGLDIRATAEVHERLREAARAGVAVIVYSTDLDEVLERAERVLVVHRGRVSEAPRGADRRAVGAMMLGVERPG
jgi:simple sugar transport system ATP-binding protein